MPVTAKDVARELNLSQPTVSRILSGDRAYRASEATRHRVWEAARRMGYQPNAVARSLRHGRTNVIGVHTSHNYDVRNNFLRTIVGALQCACGEHRLDVMLHSAQHGSSAEEIYSKLRDGRVDGLILHADRNDELIEILGRSPLPVVAVADAIPNLNAVTSDDAAGMTMLLDELWRRGHRRFVFLAPPVPLPSIELRQATFEAELQARGVAPADRRVIPVCFEDTTGVLEELLAEAPRAVCCWNDRTAYNLLGSCLQRGVQIPEQLAVAGFDGFRDDQIPARMLLTVKCPWEEVATVALKRLIELIDSRMDKREPSAPHEIRLPVSLLDGDTA